MQQTNDSGQPIGSETAWAGARQPGRTQLTGDLVRLEPMTEQHASALFDALADHRELWTYQAEEPPESVDALAALIRSVNEQSDTVAYAIVDQATRRVVGRSSYLRIQPAVGSV